MRDVPIGSWCSDIAQGGRMAEDDARSLAEFPDLARLMKAAERILDAGHGNVISVSRKVFIPLTQLCRDVCHYCTFAHPPRHGGRAFLDPQQVLNIARAGAAAGCDEALFTLGDKPELRYRVARDELAACGHASTLTYLKEACALVLSETGLLPHINAGVMEAADVRELRAVSASQGLMLETISERLSARGGAHWGSPDKIPARRLATIRAAGQERVPFTSGLLIGIGETRAERIEGLLALRSLHEAHGHLQEIIIQNFRPKPGTRMAGHPPASLEEHVWTVAVARLIFGAAMAIQAPPNMRAGELAHLIAAGISDWGGVSPVTIDHVNPEAPWPQLTRLQEETARAGKVLVPRLALYPAYARDLDRWVAAEVRASVLRRMDAEGYAHETSWRVGRQDRLAGWPAAPAAISASRSELGRAIDDGYCGRPLSEEAICRLLSARGTLATALCEAADALRREAVGDTVSYVVTRNINYTNVCGYRCQFCAFSKGKSAEHLRGSPYDLGLEEIVRRAQEAWDRGATEVCMQGGIHPDYTGNTYLQICRAVKEAAPRIHVHAFSPLEVAHGAKSLGMSVKEFLRRLIDNGLGSLPGTAAEILDDDVRRQLCADKLSTAQWLQVVEQAHRVGLRTTATIMFGHIDRYEHVARHLLHIRRLQERTGGFTEFVPLPFVHMEAPIYLRGSARQGPSFREAVLMHAVARLVLNPVIQNIQVSWVKMGEEGVTAALAAGCNDLGGTLMNESISRAAGTEHGQEMPPERMDRIIRACGGVPRQRTTLYGTPPEGQVARSYEAATLAPVVQTPARKHARVGSAASAFSR